MQQNIQMTQIQLKHIKIVWFFLFVNTKSGGGWGKCYVELKRFQYQFQHQNDIKIYVSIHDLLSINSKTEGFKKAVALQNKDETQVRIIICGGDGTIIWGLQESQKAGVNFQKVCFGCIPIGTGNDFSRSIGWGYHPVKLKDHDTMPLKRRVIQWMESTITTYDIWQIQLNTYQNGDICIAKGNMDVWTSKKKYNIGFSNYVGIGIDARVSYDFQMNRKPTRCMNLMVYICCGLINLCKSIQQISSSFQQFYEGQKADFGLSHVEQQNDIQKDELFDSSKHHLKKIQIKKGYHGLVCLNSTSYMGGISGVWDTKKIGNQGSQSQFGPQKYNDGKIQFLGFRNQLSLAKQAFSHSGDKVAQGQGPFMIRFKKSQFDNQTFIQIDGQGLKIKHLKQLIIRKHSKIPNGKIRIMSRNNL